MENEKEDEENGGENDDEFVELLHMNLEEKRLKGVLDSAVDLSEVKKVRHFDDIN